MQDKDKTSNARKIQLDELKVVMDTRSGRNVLYRHLESAGVFRLSYAGSTNDTMFNEGRRNQGLFLMSEMQSASTNLYFQMMKENTNATN